MEDVIKYLRTFGDRVANLNPVSIAIKGAENIQRNIPQIQQMIQQRFEQALPKMQQQNLLDNLRVAYGQAQRRASTPPAFNLSPILGPINQYSQQVQQDFTQRITPFAKQAENLFQDFRTRGQRIDERYLQPAKGYIQDVASFAGIGETPEGLRRRQNFAQLNPMPTNEQMMEQVINVSPMGYAKVLTPTQKLAMQKMKGLLTYTDSLIKRGMPKVQAQRMSFNQATKWIENFDNSGNRSLRFLNEQMQEAKILKDPTNAAKEIDQLIQTTDVKKKVNLLDYFRTPDRILKKLGLENESNLIKQKYSDYLDELPKEIDRITQWSKRVTSDANQRIFQWLDGKKVNLADNELQVAAEIKDYLKSWADRLKLPADKRVSDYITHLFPQGSIEKEFDPEIASLIRGKIAGSVYDPFLKQRLNKPEYLEDTWKALDAYIKRASRKFHMDQALEQVKAKAENLEESQYNYVKSYIDRINLRPTEIDNLIDNFIKSSPFGYRAGQRPLTVITQNARKMVYRGLLGLNVKTALLNLTQGANTYSKLGEKYTLLGYSKVIQNLPKFLAGKGTELHDVGILRNNIIEDRTLSATKQLAQKFDDGLFYLFNLAEKINRGAAYWGAKSRALAQGKTEQEAIKEAIDLVRQTQFTFGSVDTPLALSSDLAKTFGQFQSFTLKQGEFLGEMIKNRDILGMIRWTAASLFMVSTIGRLWGMKVEDLIPTVRIGVPPTLQLPYGGVQAVTQDKDKFGNSLTLQERVLNRDVTRGLVNYIPGGAQIRKAYEGIKGIQEGGSYTESGRLRYPVEEGVQPVIFGPGTTPGAQQYYNQDFKPLSESETETYKMLIAGGMDPQQAYSQIRAKQEEKRDFEESLKPQEQKGFNLFSLFGLGVKKQDGQVSVTQSRGDALLDAVSKEKEVDERTEKIRKVFKSGLTKEQIEQVLLKNNLGSYEEGAIIMIKSLGVENGNRGAYLKTLLTGLSSQEYLKTVNYLAQNKLLTTSVTTQWLANDEINYQQKASLDSLIKQVTGKSTGFKKLKIKKAPALKKLTVGKIKVSKPKKIAVPKIKPLKPIKIQKIRGFKRGGIPKYANS